MSLAGLTLPVFCRRLPSNGSRKPLLLLPGPSHAHAPVAVRQPLSSCSCWRAKLGVWKLLKLAELTRGQLRHRAPINAPGTCAAAPHCTILAPLKVPWPDLWLTKSASRLQLRARLDSSSSRNCKPQCGLCPRFCFLGGNPVRSQNCRTLLSPGCRFPGRFSVRYPLGRGISTRPDDFTTSAQHHGHGCCTCDLDDPSNSSIQGLNYYHQ